MATTIKARSAWKVSKIDPRLLADTQDSGFVCLQELTDYEIVTGGAKASASTSEKTSKKQNVKKHKEADKELTKHGPAKTQKGMKPKPRKLQKGVSSSNRTAGKKPKPPGRVFSGSQVVEIVDEESNATGTSQKKKKKRKRENDVKSQPPYKKLKKEEKKNRNKPKVLEEAPKVVEKVTAPSSENKEMPEWRNLFVPKQVLKSLSEKGFTSPTPIQALALPSAIRDRMDVVGAAETGSGKTLAFGIPLINTILKLKEKQQREGESMEEAEADGEDGEKEQEDEEEEDDEEEEEEEGEGDREEKELLEKDAESSDSATSGSDTDEDSEADEEAGIEPSEGGGMPFIVDMGDLLEEGQDEEDSRSDDEEHDLSPDEEDFEELQDDQKGCVRIVNDVSFDWLEKVTPSKQHQPMTRPLYALVLTPTRELAIQVRDHIQAVANHANIKVAAVVGGMAAQKQERLLKKGPEIVVATPGRLWELIQEGEPHLSQVEDIRCLVIDEADRMVEKGHFEELSKLLLMINSNEEKRRRRQTFVFSATLSLVHTGPDRMLKKKKKKKMTSKEKLDALVGEIGIKQRHKVIDLSRKEGTAESLTEARINCRMEEKDYYMYYFLQQYPGRTLVFANSKDCIRRLISVFKLLEVCPLALHADMHQKQRLKNLDRFKGNPQGLLLATDVAARGLDIPNVQHVLHYQVPRTTENYVHRSGRTARASKEGLSVVLVGPEDLKNYRKIIRTLNRDQDLALFPVNNNYMSGVKQRVNLACDIDKQEHRVEKKKAENNWFERTAREMDIELDEDLLGLNDLGDSREQAEHRNKLQHMKGHLKVMLSQPLIPQSFSGRYPTKTGKLLMPYIHKPAEGDAVKRVKEERKVDRQLLAKHPLKPKPSLQQKRTEKQSKRQLKKQKYKKKPGGKLK